MDDWNGTDWSAAVWSQFGAAIDMLNASIDAFPREYWDDESQCWYLAYHTLFWLDCYLDESLEAFSPPPPFNKDEADPAGIMPERPYSQVELLDYLRHCRTRCRNRLESLSDDDAHERCGFEKPALTNAELILYNLRHVQHGVAQLNLHLRLKTENAPGWVSRTKS